MSLITHCPACGTTFKVVSDQLKISDGWVRCGQCSEVFDTATTLRQLNLSEIAPSEDGSAANSFDVSLDDDLNDALLTMVSTPQAEPEVEPKQDLTTASTADVDIATVEEDSYFYPLVPDILLDDTPISAPDVDVDALMPIETEKQKRDFSRSLSDSMQAFEREKALSEAESNDAESGSFSFITKATAASRWQSTGVQVALVVMGLVLMLLLGGQVLVHERDRLASADPRWMPVLERLCDALHCQIQPFRRIEAMTVDASSFNKQRGDVYRLNFVVRNTATMALARPAIELTLTDSQDLPLLRRVLLPSELSASSLDKSNRGDSNTDVTPLAGGAEWVGSYLVSLKSLTDDPPLTKAVAGYRVLAFYP